MYLFGDYGWNKSAAGEAPSPLITRVNDWGELLTELLRKPLARMRKDSVAASAAGKFFVRHRSKRSLRERCR